MNEPGPGPVDRRLVDAVQANCHIADARHAGDMTLCTYLLQMREFFRWERGLPFGATLARDAIGAWIAEREALWETLERQDFVALPCGPDAGLLDPFDAEQVNRWLHPQGLLYGAGLVGSERPVFFLARLHGRAQRDGLDVLVGGAELARGLLAPPAALGSGSGTVVLRRESLARWCWEKFEAFGLRQRPGSAFHAVVRAYGLDQDFDAALPSLLDEQGETLVLHELGEHRAGRMLGPGWTRMRLGLPTRRADLYARAVRDHLADLAVTLPTLLDQGRATAIHFWFANYDGLRKLLFPSLESAYADWVGGDAGRALRGAAARGRVHFTQLAQTVLALHAADPEHAGPAIEQLLGSPAAVCPDQAQAGP